MPSRVRISEICSPRLAPREAVERGGVEQVLHRAELAEEGGLDAHPVDEPLHGALLAHDVMTEDLDPAVVRQQQCRDQADQSRFARAVRAEHADDLAPVDGQGDVFYRPHDPASPFLNSGSLEDAQAAAFDKVLRDVLNHQGIMQVQTCQLLVGEQLGSASGESSLHRRQ